MYDPVRTPTLRGSGLRAHRRASLSGVPAHPLAMLLTLLFTLLAACDDGVAPDVAQGRILGVVLNSIDVSLSVFDAEDPSGAQPVTIGLAPAGSPVSLAVRGRWAAVPLGTVPAVAVVDLTTSTVARTVALPEGSGATGVAFLDDSVAVVANPGRNTVSTVNVRSGVAGPEVAVGLYPQGVVVVEDRVVVVNGEIGPDFLPVGPGTLTVLERETLSRVGTVTLSGENPGAAVAASDGRLYVVLSGSFGAGDGALSVVDLQALGESDLHEGFGEFPFSAAFSPSGRLHVGSFAYGVAVWDAASETFVRSPGDAIAPEAVPSTSGLGFDPEGRLYALRPECSAAGAALRLDASYSVEAVIPVGTCPIAIAFTEIPE